MWNNLRVLLIANHVECRIVDSCRTLVSQRRLQRLLVVNLLSMRWRFFRWLSLLRLHILEEVQKLLHNGPWVRQVYAQVEAVVCL